MEGNVGKCLTNYFLSEVSAKSPYKNVITNNFRLKNTKQIDLYRITQYY